MSATNRRASCACSAVLSIVSSLSFASKNEKQSHAAPAVVALLQPHTSFAVRRPLPAAPAGIGSGFFSNSSSLPPPPSPLPSPLPPVQYGMSGGSGGGGTRIFVSAPTSAPYFTNSRAASVKPTRATKCNAVNLSGCRRAFTSSATPERVASGGSRADGGAYTSSASRAQKLAALAATCSGVRKWWSSPSGAPFSMHVRSSFE
mmetsp:Transcript_39584/g.96947  ORF Transcript_39584/g.96947 Transcript_39584/m.96947 type:complete len:203 (-) Transcript_39584:812-1420(-)